MSGCVEYSGKVYDSNSLIENIRKNPQRFLDNNDLNDEINDYFQNSNDTIRFSLSGTPSAVVSNIQNKLSFLSKAKKQALRVLKNFTYSSGNLNSILSEDARQLDRDENAIFGVLSKEQKYFNNLKKSILAESKTIANTKGLDYKKVYAARIKLIRDYLAGDTTSLSVFNPEIQTELKYFRNRIDEAQSKLMLRFANSMVNFESEIKELQKELGNFNPSNMTSRQEYLQNRIKYLNNKIASTQDFINKIELSKTSYLNRSYQIFTDKEYAREMLMQETDRAKERFKNASNFIADIFKNQDISNGKPVMSDSEYKRLADREVMEYIAGINSSKGSDLSFTGSSQVKGIFKKLNTNLDVSIRELLGEHTDPELNYVNTIFKISKYVAEYDFQQNLNNSLFELGIGSTEPKAGYVLAMNNVPEHSPMSGIYVPLEVKEELDDRDLQPIKDDFIKNWIKLAGKTKVGLTILSPTTQFRNLWSGIFLGLNAGHSFLFSPKNILPAVRFATNNFKKYELAEFEKLVKLGIINDGLSSGQFNEDLKNLGNQLEAINKDKNILDKTWSILQTAYGFGDDFFKVIGYYQELNGFLADGMSQQEAEKKAGERIRNSYPTYSYLPNGLKALRRFPLIGSFVSFPYEVVRTTKNNLIYAAEDFKAGRYKMGTSRAVGMALSSFTGIALSTLSMMLMGWDDEDDDAFRTLLSEFQKDSQLFYFGYDKNGKPTYMDMTPFFGAEVIIKPLRILFEERQGRDLTDKVKLAFEEALKPYVSKDIFTNNIFNIFENEDNFGKPIWYEHDDFGDKATKITKYLAKNSIGLAKNIEEYLRANEINPKEFGRKTTSYGREFNNVDATYALFGFRVSSWNIPQLVGFKIYDVSEKSNAMSSQISKDFKNGVYTEKEMTDYVAKVSEKYDKQFNPLRNAITAAKKLGISQDEIKESIKSKGKISKDKLNAIFSDGKVIINKDFDRNLNNYAKDLKSAHPDDVETQKKLLTEFTNNALLFNKLLGVPPTRKKRKKSIY